MLLGLASTDGLGGAVSEATAETDNSKLRGESQHERTKSFRLRRRWSRASLSNGVECNQAAQRAVKAQAARQNS
jgi:hypothetical protein